MPFAAAWIELEIIIQVKSVRKGKTNTVRYLFATPWTRVHGILQARILDLLSLLQGIFSTQGSNPGLPHCRQILYQLSHRGSPRKLEWVAFPFSRGCSQPRDQTGVSCSAGRFFTSWACSWLFLMNSDNCEATCEHTWWGWHLTN